MIPTIVGKRLLVVEEALKDHVGHWYEYVKSVVELNGKEGVLVTAVVHCRVLPEISKELSAIPAFERSNWDGVYAHPRAWRRYLGVFRHNWLVYRTMSQIIDKHGPFDCLFAPTVIVHHVLGWRLLFAIKGRKIKRLVLLFRNNAGSYEPGSSTPKFKRSAAILATTLRSFSKSIRSGRVLLATDSDRLAREYELLCGLRPVVFPSPRLAQFLDQPDAPKTQNEPLIFSSLGPARFEKGIDLLQEAIKLCLRRGLKRPVKFVIQWNQPILEADGQEYFPDTSLVGDDRVEFIRRPLESAEYDATIARSDCLLLPYRRDSYFARISGVAVEAATAGIPMIFTNDTWNADLVDKFGAGIGVEDGDIEGLANAVNAMIEGFELFHKVAIERKTAAQDAHSAHTFIEKLWGWP